MRKADAVTGRAAGLEHREAGRCRHFRGLAEAGRGADRVEDRRDLPWRAVGSKRTAASRIIKSETRVRPTTRLQNTCADRPSALHLGVRGRVHDAGRGGAHADGEALLV